MVATRRPAYEQVRADMRDLWPRLTRFYGISPVELATWPRWMVELYASRMDQLIGEEQLRSLEVGQVAWMKEESQRSLIRHYQTLAKGQTGERKDHRMTLKDFIALGGAGGMAVKRESA